MDVALCSFGKDALFLSTTNPYSPMRQTIFAMLALAAGLTAGGCDMLGGGREATAPVGVTFETLASNTGETAGKQLAPDSLVIDGTNGQLVIQDIQLIAAELELKKPDAACPDSVADEDSCEKFEADMQLLDLPLDGSSLEVTGKQDIPSGTYVELEVEIEDIALDAEDNEKSDEERAQIDAVRSEIDAAGYANWPNEASAVVRGSFTPSGGSRADFVTYLDAEIELELTLEPPLTITGGEPSRSVVVRFQPDLWFERADGTVQDLSTSSGELTELEAEFEDGVAEVEIETDS